MAVVFVWERLASIDWAKASAIATCIGALATFFMVFLTWRTIVSSRRQHEELYRQALDARKQSETQHQQALRPVVVIASFDGVSPSDRSGRVEFDQVMRTEGTRYVRVHGVLRNIGVGPALNVRLHFQAMEIEGYGATQELAPLQAGATFGGADVPLDLPLRLGDKFNATDFALAAGTLWELVIEYQDVYGNKFRTVHPKNASRPWTSIENGG